MPRSHLPPPAVGLLAVTVGLLPSATAVLWAWFAVNVVALGWVTVGLSRLWEGRPLGTTTPVRRKHLLIAVLVFPPTFHTFVAGQFPLVALALLLAAGDRRLPPWVRGVALGLALVKPSVALPFFLLPVVAREWRVVAWAVAVQVAATLSVVALTGGTVGLFRDWLAVAPFFMQGMYTLQDWLNAVGTQASWLPPAASLASLAACAATLAVARHRPRAQLFSVAAVTSAFWTYHGPYDFVVLLPVLLGWVGLAANRAGGGWSPAGLTLFAALAPATTPAVMGGTGATTRAARWLGRLEVIGLVGAEYWSALRLGVRQSRVKASTSPGLPGLRRRLPS